MNDKFRVGQMVRLVQSANRLWDVGVLGTIVEGQAMRTSPRGRTRLAYLVDFADKGESCCPETFLAPIYDGDQASSWSECAWKPKKETA